MYATNKDDNDDNDHNEKDDSHEHFEKSVLAPLRRRLSDDGGSKSVSTVQNTMPEISVSIIDRHVEISKENDQNLPPKYDHANVMGLPVSETKATPDVQKQSQPPTKFLKSWWVYKQIVLP